MTPTPSLPYGTCRMRERVERQRRFEMTEEEIAALSRRIVKAIERDFTDRRGLRQEWEQIDDDVKKDIRKTWRTIVALILAE